MADELDALFARARELNEEDDQAAERAVTRLRTVRSRSKLRIWTSALLASAAMIGGLAYLGQNQLGQSRDLPISAAYDALAGVSGDGW